MKYEQKLTEKGWSPEEIAKVKTEFNYAASKKKQTKFKGKFVFWVALIGAVIANIFLTLVMVPVMIVSGNIFSAMFTALISIIFGFMFFWVIKEIDEADYRYHVIFCTIIPFFSIINVHISTYIANAMIKIIQTNSPQKNPMIMGIVFGAAFITPFIFYIIKEYLSKKKREQTQNTTS